MKTRNKRKPARPKIKLGLPDLEQAKAAVVGSLPSRGSKRVSIMNDILARQKKGRGIRHVMSRIHDGEHYSLIST